jgi:hypothetical protein
MVRKWVIVTDNCDWHLRRANVAGKWLILSVQTYGNQIFGLNRVFLFISQKTVNHVHNIFLAKINYRYVILNPNGVSRR